MHRFNAQHQAAMMWQLWPEFNTSRYGNKMVSRGVMRPSPLTSRYRIRIEYTEGSRPKVIVEHPAISPIKGGKTCPHRYRGGMLCLHLPHDDEWCESDSIAKTTMPWTAEWLIHYESWRFTGEWHGGGEHPPDN